MTDTIDAYIRDYIAKLGWSLTQKRAAKQQFEKKGKMGFFYSHGTRKEDKHKNQKFSTYRHF